MNSKRERLSEQLRQAILAAPMTRYRICKQLGIHQATLSRFVHGERGLPLELIDELGELLGLRLVVDDNADAAQPGEKQLAARRPPARKKVSTKPERRKKGK